MSEERYNRSVRNLIQDVWDIRGEIYSLGERFSELREADDSGAVTEFRVYIESLLEKMNRHPEVFEDYIRFYKDIAENIYALANMSLASALEKKVSEFKGSLWTRQELAEETQDRRESQQFSHLQEDEEVDDDLPF